MYRYIYSLGCGWIPTSFSPNNDNKQKGFHKWWNSVENLTAAEVPFIVLTPFSYKPKRPVLRLCFLYISKVFILSLNFLFLEVSVPVASFKHRRVQYLKHNRCAWEKRARQYGYRKALKIDWEENISWDWWLYFPVSRRMIWNCLARIALFFPPK